MAQNKCKDVEKYLNKEIHYLHELIKKANGKQHGENKNYWF